VVWSVYADDNDDHGNDNDDHGNDVVVRSKNIDLTGPAEWCPLFFFTFFSSARGSFRMPDGEVKQEVCIRLLLMKGWALCTNEGAI
jgi:hypothetical protein